MMLCGPDECQLMYMLYQNEEFLHPSSPCRMVNPHQQGLFSHWGWDQSFQRGGQPWDVSSSAMLHYALQHNLETLFGFFVCF